MHITTYNVIALSRAVVGEPIYLYIGTLHFVIWRLFHIYVNINISCGMENHPDKTQVYIVIGFVASTCNVSVLSNAGLLGGGGVGLM